MTYKKLFPLLLFMLMLLAACGGAYDSASMAESGNTGALPPMEEPARAAADTMDAVFAVADGAYMAEQSGSAGEMAEIPDQSAASQATRLIIRTANLGLLVTDTEETVADITRLAEQSGGWVVTSNLYQYNQNAKSGDITIRIPATGFNSAMEALKSMAVEVLSENISGQDVTEEYVDLEARLANLEATAVRVRTFLDEAITVEEALAVNQELSRLEGEIEVLKGRMQYLSQSAAFSTISVSLTPDITTQPVQVAGWRPQGVAKAAVEALLGTLQWLADGAIWLAIYPLPLALLIGVPAWLVLRFTRRRWQQRGNNITPPVSST